MADESDLIAEFYDRHVGQEWSRMDRYPLEFALTMKAIQDYLPSPPARVLDCGGGPGRYSISLARQGYLVTLYDLSSKNLEKAREMAELETVNLEDYEHGSATDLSRFPDRSFDAVLLMGPLYHLLESEDRRHALREAYRVTKPSGVILATWISRYAAHRDAALKEPLWISQAEQVSEKLLETGRLLPRRSDGQEFIAYMAHPSEVEPLMWECGWEVQRVLGVEGIVSMIEQEINKLSGVEWDKWVDLNYRVASDVSIHGCVEHLLVIPRRPAWKDVIKMIAVRLKDAGVQYNLAGGSSIALQGVNTPVNDLDIEVDRAGAYIFQDLFADLCVMPVSLSQGITYRSYFGRFLHEGVQIEVMGDLHRKEGDQWKPSFACNRRIVEIEGVPVYVSWLEEEMLAYIRRGRLDRAGQCLQHCNPERLLSLLRGERPLLVL